MTLKTKSNIFFSSLAFFLIGCEKEEIAIPAHEAGDEMTNEISMEEDYRNQIFFDLGTNSIVSTNLKTDWDLGFHRDGNHIVLNSSKAMAVHKSNLAFNEITSEAGLEWNWDVHSGNLDSPNQLFVIDRGYSHDFVHQGYYKLMVSDIDADGYDIEFGELQTNVPMSATIEKANLTQFSYFSFNNGLVSIAPPDEEYDLVFTQYTHLFTDPLTPYLVSGALLNRSNTEAVLYLEKPFSEISLEDVTGLDYSEDINVIGYDWKWFDFEASSYITDPEMVYILRSWEGAYYKLHFTSFYNNAGLKGFPNIEFQEL